MKVKYALLSVCSIMLSVSGFAAVQGSGKPLVSYTPESVTITQSEEYRYERKTLSRRI